MALNFGLLDQGGPTNFFEGYRQADKEMQANAMAQQRAAQAQQEFGMRQQEFAAGQAEKKRVSDTARVTQKLASFKDALLRAPNAKAAGRIVQLQYDDSDLGPLRRQFGSLQDALAEIPEETTAFQKYIEDEAMGMEEARKQRASDRAFNIAMGLAPQTNAMGGAPAAPAPAPAVVAPTTQASIDDLVKSGIPREAITVEDGKIYVGSYGSNVVGEPTMEQYRTPEGSLALRPQAPLTPLRVAANQMAPSDVNAMAPQAAAAPAAPPQTQLQSLVDQYERFSRIANPDKRVENRIKFLAEEIARLSKRNLYTVAGVGLVDADTKKIVYASQEKGTLLSQLQTDLAAATDPKVRKEIQARIDKETSHQPATSVTVSTEKTYGGKLADKLADRDDAKLGAAEKAPQLAESANRIISLVNQGNLFTGPIAGIKLNIARALNVAGASNEEKISNTESLIAATGQSTLDAIKSAGLGTGQGFTDKDLKFLQQIAGGTFELTPQTLTRLATLQHQAAVRSVEAWNTRFTQIPSSATGALGLSTVPKIPPLAGASTSSGFKYLGKESN